MAILERLRLPGWVRPAFRRAGFELVRLTPASHSGSRTLAMLGSVGVDLVLDVGANTGQYARRLRETGYRGRIVSFEPLAGAFETLRKESAEDALWEAERIALGAAPGKAQIHIAANSWSSSLLEMLPRHLESAPGSAYIGSEEVSVQTLGWALKTWQRGAAHTFVKLDVQGSERAVLEGAGVALDELAGLQIELSLVPLYQGEMLFLEMISLLTAKGFVLMDLEAGHRDPATGQLLQMDGIFLRPVGRGAG